MLCGCLSFECDCKLLRTLLKLSVWRSWVCEPLCTCCRQCWFAATAFLVNKAHQTTCLLFDVWPTRPRIGHATLASCTMNLRARVQFPEQARPTKQSILPGSVNWQLLMNSEWPLSKTAKVTVAVRWLADKLMQPEAHTATRRFHAVAGAWEMALRNAPLKFIFTFTSFILTHVTSVHTYWLICIILEKFWQQILDFTSRKIFGCTSWTVCVFHLRYFRVLNLSAVHGSRDIIPFT